MEIRLCAFADEAGSTLQEQMTALKRNNIRLIELRNVNGKNVADLSLSEAKAIKEKLDENGIDVWSIGSPLGKSRIEDDFSIEEKRLWHILKLCEVFNCNKIRMFSFFTTKYEHFRGEIIDRLNKMCAVSKKHGVTLCHENEKDIYGDIAERVNDLLENVKDLSSVYDPANFLQCGQDIDEAMQLLFDKTDYFHIKDVIMSSGEIVPAGMGDGKIDALIGKMKKDYVLTVEPHLAVFDGYDKIDGREMKNKYTYQSNNEAFDCAVSSIKNILIKNSFKEENKKWVKQ